MITKNMKIEKILNYLAVLTLMVAAFFITVVIVWSTYPYKPMVVKGITLLNKDLKSGDILQYDLDYCRYTDKTAMISRRYVDTIYFSTPDVTALNPKGCQVKTIGISIPNTLPSGIYSLQVSYSYKVNPIRTVTIKVETDSFMVTNISQLDTDR